MAKIVDFSHKKVFDAQTYTAISFINKKENETILYDKIRDEQACDDFLTSTNGSPNYIKNLNVKKWKLLKTKKQEAIKKLKQLEHQSLNYLILLLELQRLKMKSILLTVKTEENGYLKKETENGVFYIEKEITKPVYKISKIKNQEDINSNTLRIVTPYKVGKKTATPILETEFKAKYPKCYEYLLSEREKLASRDKGKTVFKPFYVWGRTQGISRIGKKILNPTFSKHPRFLFVPEEDAYYTNGYGIYFNKDISKKNMLFDNLTHSMSKEENILIVQKILNSIVMDYYITETSVSIQGGFPCYQKNFIELFTIPNFSTEELKVLNSLSEKDEIDAFLIEKYQLNITVPNLV